MKNPTEVKGVKGPTATIGPKSQGSLFTRSCQETYICSGIQNCQYCLIPKQYELNVIHTFEMLTEEAKEEQKTGNKVCLVLVQMKCPCQ
ncbi:hypothetical protein QQF64_019513 [Cirrhinus molitorella]|uniref:Uncharacterized protein n=1 Tax=Cirrhinus molitorella TaxID=172907 RepID=A0ABR3LFM5_9TELE